MKKLISSNLKKIQKSQSSEKLSMEKEIKDYVAKVYEYLNNLKKAVQKNENSLKEEINEIKKQSNEKDKQITELLSSKLNSVLVSLKKQSAEIQDDLKKDAILFNKRIDHIENVLLKGEISRVDKGAGTEINGLKSQIKELREQLVGRMEKTKFDLEIGIDKIQKQVKKENAEIRSLISATDTRHDEVEAKQKETIKKLHESFDKRSVLFEKKFDAQAKKTLISMGTPGTPCMNCSTCSVDCSMGFDIRDRVLDISRLIEVPDEFLV